MQQSVLEGATGAKIVINTEIFGVCRIQIDY